jgi:hypothetical protein
LEEMDRISYDGTDGVNTQLPPPSGASGRVDRNRARGLSLVAVLTALYVVANAIPIDAFLGGSGFITAGIVLLPVMARLVRPREAVVLAVLAPLGLLAFQLSVIPAFGFFGLAIPALAILLGSLGSYKSYLLPASYIMFGAVWYFLFSGGTLLWLAPYGVAVVISVAQQGRLFRGSKRWETLVHVVDTTMCELVTMNILSVSLLQLPGGLWTVITPFMFLERGVAVVGGTSIISILARIKGPLRLEGI